MGIFAVKGGHLIPIHFCRLATRPIEKNATNTAIRMTTVLKVYGFIKYDIGRTRRPETGGRTQDTTNGNADTAGRCCAVQFVTFSLVQKYGERFPFVQVTRLP